MTSYCVKVSPACSTVADLPNVPGVRAMSAVGVGHRGCWCLGRHHGGRAARPPAVARTSRFWVKYHEHPQPVSGSSTRRAVPAPAGLCTARVPPSASTRSFNPTSPEPRTGSAPPTPSLRTRSHDRRPDFGAGASLPGVGSERSGKISEVVDPGRAACPQHERGLTDAMGGTLQPEETPGGGLTMAISVPAASGPTQPRPGSMRRLVGTGLADAMNT